MCQPCPADFFTEATGASDVNTCTRCPPDSSTVGKVAQNTRRACECFGSFYAAGSMNESLNCQKCPKGAICSDEKECALRQAGLRCSDGSRITGEWLSNSSLTGDSVYRLRTCPLGTLLVNSTLEGQRCMPCEAHTYSLDFEYGCTKRVCSPRACLPCPQGADCSDASSFVSRVNGTEWYEVSEQGILRKRIATCPPGHTLFRDANAVNDHCKACEYGKYTIESASRTNQTCLSCPAGAQCSGGKISSTQAGYWMLKLLAVDGHEVLGDVDCSVEGQVCAMLSVETKPFGNLQGGEMSCTNLSSAGLVCARKQGEGAKRRATETDSIEPFVLLCPHGACGANNFCLQNRTGKTSLPIQLVCDMHIALNNAKHLLALYHICTGILICLLKFSLWVFDVLSWQVPCVEFASKATQ